MNLQQLSIDLQWKKASDEVMDLWEKAAVNPPLRPPKKVLERLGEYLNLWPGEYPGGIPNHPGTLQSMLVGGLTGGALGYGAGWLAEKFLPKSWERKKTRRAGALLGALAGISPGILQGGMSANIGGSFLQPEIFQESKRAELSKEVCQEIRESFTKVSANGFGLHPIPVNQFQDTIWNDPRVADRLPLPMQAAASGLVMGAARLPGKRQGTKLITPMDMGRMAAGMGSGYLSGALVGKGLGLLFGMPESTQDRLKETGMFAGVISNLVPVAFGG